MSAFLLDVNVLLALAWPTHLHHGPAHRWFSQHHGSGWATCPVTQLGFVRLSMQPAVVKVPLHFADAMEALSQIVASPQHCFWPMETGLAAIQPDIRLRIAGHHQLTDATLLDLAIRHGGRLATLDRKVAALLPPNSAHQSSVVTIPT